MRQTVFAIVLWVVTTLSGWAQRSEVFTPEAFHIEITDMLPRPFFFRYGTTDFSLSVHNDSAFVRMPYYGKADAPSFEYDGLNFEHKYEHMMVGKTEKKDADVVTFRVQHGSVEHRFYITAYPDHRADISVMPNNGQACAYEGRWSNIDQRQLLYVGLVLDEASVNTLKAFAKHSMPWSDAKLFCHHMTIAHYTNITRKLRRWAEKHEGQTFTITATDYGHSDKAFAVKVDPKKVPSINALTHVTLATNNATNGKDYESNQITQWQPFPTPIQLTGTIEFIYR